MKESIEVYDGYGQKMDYSIWELMNLPYEFEPKTNTPRVANGTGLPIVENRGLGTEVGPLEADSPSDSSSPRGGRHSINRPLTPDNTTIRSSNITTSNDGAYIRVCITMPTDFGIRSWRCYETVIELLAVGIYLYATFILTSTLFLDSTRSIQFAIVMTIVKLYSTIRLMNQFRLYELSTGTLESYEIGHAPPYIAVSHAWSDHIFSTGVETSFGGAAVRKIIADLFPAIRHCWIDNFCIIQDDDADKIEQIPLMGAIYHGAAVVSIVLTCEFGFAQEDVDRAQLAVHEAVEAWKNEAWAEEEFVRRWRDDEARRGALVQAMKGLARLTKSSWATRIWTLQEYVLASSVLWIGLDLHPVVIDDMLFQALPGLCDQLCITECISRAPESEFAVLYTHFSGMANSRLGAIEPTRVMELLGNRKATVAVDEVYGIMAACGVEIEPIIGESREAAWGRWWEAAVCEGHLRWAMLPPAPLIDKTKVSVAGSSNCIIPEFAHRHSVSAASYLNSMAPLGTCTVDDGTLTLSGRLVGNCTLLRKLGSVHRSQNDLFHRDITLILFARGRWSDALQIVEAFGPGRYNRKQQLSLAHILVDNHSKVLRYIRRNSEMDFHPSFRSNLHYRVWGDFMQLLSRCIMDGLNDGIGYLARIRHPSLDIFFTTVVIVGNYLPTSSLIALDFNAVTEDQRLILLIAEVPMDLIIPEDSRTTMASLHKLGTTIPVTLDYNGLWGTPRIERFDLGGSRCHVCTASPQNRVKTRKEQGCSLTVRRSRIMPAGVGVLLRRDRLERVERLENIRKTLNFSALNRSRKRYLRLRR
ncbi:uncharacterized protein K460DRAFT_416329 [Cucurbitaria berberidis CBS 394.84]|uniref:Heterokaryon incompatibility domain-containing protein n=1 Tax=Cucurbitaria berberidis CBS 394.84 TaxID=1168544 RepID=A0A9P4GFA8_9PLEO|nr:uncharacterized protein K460DRAFT_416329 [Cucurbitaria berberidis CBS 394.84]KAF1844993.1 hypothetical protein K460DRAFT_416329 [Cucurbitaria berberidis CBS 394.84]